MRAVAADDIDALLAVHLSNPGYIGVTEGSGGEPGRYDRGMLERDLVIAGMTPGRHLAGIVRRADSELIGVLDWMEENPSDGQPWIGLVMIRADQHRRGYAREAVEALAYQLRAAGKTALRASVVARNGVGRALADRLGFEPVSTTTKRMASEEAVIVLERELVTDLRAMARGHS